MSSTIETTDASPWEAILVPFADQFPARLDDSL